MKTVVVILNDREIERFQLTKQTIFIGRSPTCDVILRVKSVKPVHFVLDWVGSGEFDPEQGFWSLVDISHHSSKEATSGEGVVLGAENVRAGIFEFRLTKDELAESHLKRGILKRTVEESLELETIRSEEGSCLEVVSIHNSLESVESVDHYSFASFHLVRGALKSFPEMKFTWMSAHLGFIECGNGPKDYQILNKNEVIVPLGESKERIEVSDKDIIIVRSEDYDYYLRLVPRVKVVKGRDLGLDKNLLTVILIVVFLCIFALILPNLPKSIEERSDNARVAQVQIIDTSLPPPLPPPIPEPVSVPIKAPEIEAKKEPEKEPEKPKQGKTPEVTEKPEPTPKPVAKAQPEEPKPVKKKSLKDGPKPVRRGGELDQAKKSEGGAVIKTPERSSAPMGLLGLLKTQKSTGSKSGVRAEQILKGGQPQPDQVPQDGQVLVPRAKSGVLTKRPTTGENGGTESVGLAGSNLSKAQSNLKSFVGSSKGGADIAKSGDSVLDGGNKNGLLKGLKSGATVGFDDGATTEVKGGLDKDSVRRAIREYQIQLRGCYERSLGETQAKEFSGKMSYTWKVSPSGDVVESRLTYSDFKMASFENCIKSIIDRIVFPKAANGQPTYVKYPFIFQGKK